MVLSGNGDAAALENEARGIAAKIGEAPEYAILLLQEIRKRHSYLSQGLGEAVSTEAGIPVSRLYGVAAFYERFRFKLRGKYLAGRRMGRTVMRPGQTSSRRSSPRSRVS
jgi:NADH:ubiquinone oxidoreductase subunit E